MGALQESGFVVLAGPYPVERIEGVADAYDAAVGSAVEDDVRIGSTSTRVVDFVNRGPLFDPLYIYPPLLDAAARIVGPSFKLSSLNARTLRPGSAVLDIHVDVARDSIDWPLLGFILMIDAFAPDNGATRFIPGSHRWGPPSERWSSAGVHRAAGVGLRASRIAARVQWINVARPGRQRLQPAPPVAAGRVHSARWSCKHGLLPPDAIGDPRAA
jgi:hypothetical protein